MSYFKIDGKDFSKCVKELKVKKSTNYNAQTNAAGDTVVDYINAKREIEVSIIPLEAVRAAEILAAVDGFSVSLSFRNPLTNALEDNVKCIIPESGIEYYTIQTGGLVMLNEFSLTFSEL